MLTGYFQSAVLLVVIVLFYAVDFTLIRRFDTRRRAEGSGRSWDYTLIMLTVALFLLAQPVLLPWLGLRLAAAWGLAIQLIGILLLAGGLSLHVWARRHLQEFYAERVEVQPGHRLIDTGPYAYVRHPVISSFFLLVTGLLLVNPSLPVLLLAGYTFWDFSRAARQEEDLLSQEIPGYRAYMQRTPGLFPRILRGGQS